MHPPHPPPKSATGTDPTQTLQSILASIILQLHENRKILLLDSEIGVVGHITIMATLSAGTLLLPILMFQCRSLAHRGLY